MDPHLDPSITGEDGYTLAEFTVALALAALTVSLTAAAVLFGTRTFDAWQDRTRLVSSWHLTTNQLRRDLHAARSVARRPPTSPDQDTTYDVRMAGGRIITYAVRGGRLYRAGRPAHAAGVEVVDFTIQEISRDALVARMHPQPRDRFGSRRAASSASPDSPASLIEIRLHLRAGSDERAGRTTVSLRPHAYWPDVAQPLAP